MTRVDIKMSITEALICSNLLDQFIKDDNVHPKDKEYAKRTIKTIDEAIEKWSMNRSSNKENTNE